MTSFLKNITPFYGTGERNSEGKTLEEFLEAYDPYKYRNPSCTTDTVVFSCRDVSADVLEELKVLLVKRSNHPSIGYWALPGGFVDLYENLEDTARRELEEETGVSGLPVEQFACYGDYDRDPRTRVITTVYMSLTEEKYVKVRAGDDAADAVWFCINAVLVNKAHHDGWMTEEYVLDVRNEERKIHFQARVEKKERKGLIREKKFTVKEGGILAVDHAAILLQAYLLLQSRKKV